MFTGEQMQFGFMLAFYVTIMYVYTSSGPSTISYHAPHEQTGPSNKTSHPSAHALAREYFIQKKDGRKNRSRRISSPALCQSFDPHHNVKLVQGWTMQQTNKHTLAAVGPVENKHLLAALVFGRAEK